MNNNNDWFWEHPPKYWTPFQWGVFFVAVIIMTAVMIFGCGIESIVEVML